MTIKEFNEKYRISILVEATQDAALSEELDDQGELLAYGSVDEIIGNTNYAVYDRETQEEVFLVDSDMDTYFLIELKEEFNITDLNV